MSSLVRPTIACFLLLLAAACTTVDKQHRIVVSVPEQRLVLLDRDVPAATFPVSTSKFGLGDRAGSCSTPLGNLEIARKIGAAVVPGTVFKDRRPTGEVVVPDSPGRDPIVSRILWLRGRETQNANAFGRYIYIHGTAEERNIGRPASYGCIRMKSADVIRLFEIVGTGAQVSIVNTPLSALVPALGNEAPPIATDSPHAGMIIR